MLYRTDCFFFENIKYVRIYVGVDILTQKLKELAYPHSIDYHMIMTTTSLSISVCKNYLPTNPCMSLPPFDVDVCLVDDEDDVFVLPGT